jgi:hypothetical protein
MCATRVNCLVSRSATAPRESPTTVCLAFNARHFLQSALLILSNLSHFSERDFALIERKRRCSTFSKGALFYTSFIGSLALVTPIAKSISPSYSSGCKFVMNRACHVYGLLAFHPLNQACQSFSLRSYCQTRVSVNSTDFYNLTTVIFFKIITDIEALIRNLLQYNKTLTVPYAAYSTFP